jgi:hypothetical protein
VRFEIRTIVEKLEIGETDELIPDCTREQAEVRSVVTDSRPAPERYFWPTRGSESTRSAQEQLAVRNLSGRARTRLDRNARCCPSRIDTIFESLLRYILPLQMAPAMNSATAKAETIIASMLSKVFRDMLGLHSLPSQAFIPNANEVTRLCAGDR